jgi:1-acyl-sn-glycerol-3-phosphate acyltransferase
MLMLTFWALCLPVAALVGFPWTLLAGNVNLLYRLGMWSAWTGVRLAGVRVQTVGLDGIDPSRTYIFMANHASNLDPPILLPLIPGRTSVLVKKELFSYPILGKTMRLGSLVPVDRGNHEAGIAAGREAAGILRQGVNMTIFVEGKRSFDGRLLPFKKGAFYLAKECEVPVVPVTIVGTHFLMPKKRFSIKPGTATIIFHDPMDPREFPDRDALLLAVRERIHSGLPPQYQEQELATRKPTKDQEGNSTLA